VERPKFLPPRKAPERKSGTGRNLPLRAQLVGHSVQIPIAENRLQLGAWQEVVLILMIK
jgi:thiamine phosphate synthase YjbQ (UPF0047 family)